MCGDKKSRVLLNDSQLMFKQKHVLVLIEAVSARRDEVWKKMSEEEDGVFVCVWVCVYACVCVCLHVCVCVCKFFFVIEPCQACVCSGRIGRRTDSWQRKITSFRHKYYLSSISL